NDVLFPTVPSTVTTRPVKRLQVQLASVQRAAEESATSSDQQPAHGATQRPLVTTPLAPRASASSAKWEPLCFRPGIAQNTSPGRIARLSVTMRPRALKSPW